MICNPHFVLREIYGVNILMPIHRNNIGNEPIYLNDVASKIWKSADGYASVDELLNAITDLYNLKSGSAEQIAIKQFITQMINMTLILE